MKLNQVASVIAITSIASFATPAKPAHATFDCFVTGESGGLLFFAGGVFSPFQLAACGLDGITPPVVVTPVVVPPVVVPPVLPTEVAQVMNQSAPVVAPSAPAAAPAMSQARPDTVFGVSTAALIQGAAVGMLAHIAYDMITGKHQNPTGANQLTCESLLAKPSGKAYRYQPTTSKTSAAFSKLCGTAAVVSTTKVETKTNVIKVARKAAAETVKVPSSVPAPKFLAPPAVKRLPAKG
jgi:hypothetical protein